MVKNFFDDQDQEPLIPTSANSLHDFKNHNIKKIIFISVILGLCIFFAAYFFFNVLKAPKAYNNSKQENEKQQPLGDVIPNVYLEIDPIIVNLLPSNSKQSDLKLSITLQLNAELDIKAVKAKFPIIVDNIQFFLRTLREADFNGTSSTLKLKEELIKRINKTTSPIVVKDVLFKEMVIN